MVIVYKQKNRVVAHYFFIYPVLDSRCATAKAKAIRGRTDRIAERDFELHSIHKHDNRERQIK